MNLKNYVKTLKPADRAEFCRRAQISQSHLSQMIAGGRGMSTAMCVKLIRASRMAITLKGLNKERYREYLQLRQLHVQQSESAQAKSN